MDRTVAPWFVPVNANPLPVRTNVNTATDKETKYHEYY